MRTRPSSELSDLPITLELRAEQTSDFVIEHTLQLPALVVLTGRNGSGKTRFLRRAATGRISRHGQMLPYGRSVIANGDLAREISFPTSDSQRVLDPSRWTVVMDPERADTNLAARVRSATATGKEVSEEEMLRLIEIERFKAIGLTAKQYARMREQLGKPLSSATELELATLAPLLPQERTPFSDEAFQTMRRYRHLQLSNTSRRALIHEYGNSPASPALSEEEFLAQYGEPPWETMTKAFEEIGLPFVVRTPEHELDQESGWTIHPPSLVKMTSTEGEVSVTEPSTGERVLIRLTSALFQERTTEAGGLWPKVLLLDEPDAYLHPAMVRQLMKLIQNLFVQQLGIVVIMTTHSPTTVALAPEGSIYLAESDSSIVPVEQHAALNELLQGVPSIVVEPADRRLVVVEDEADERLHTLAYTAVRQTLKSEQHLTFLGMTRKNSPQGGSTRVKSLVQDLRDHGQTRVWGLIDGDGKPSPQPPIFASVSRYSIENFALDPLTLGLYLCQAKEPGFDLATPTTETQWQALADTVAAKAFPHRSLEKLPVQFSLPNPMLIASEFMKLRGHDLEDHLVNQFNSLLSLRRGSTRAGAVSLTVAQAVWPLHPELIDQSLVDLYQAILDHDG